MPVAQEPPVNCREDPELGAIVAGLTKVQVESAERIFSLLQVRFAESWPVRKLFTLKGLLGCTAIAERAAGLRCRRWYSCKQVCYCDVPASPTSSTACLLGAVTTSAWSRSSQAGQGLVN